MKNFKFLLSAMLIAFGLMFTSCDKDKDTASQNQAEISFTLNEMDFDTFKGDLNDTLPTCSDLTMDYALATVEASGTTGIEYYLPIYDISTPDGTMHETKGLVVDLVQETTKLLTLTRFLVYHDVTGDGQSIDDILIKAAPAPGSEYQQFLHPDDLLNKIFAVDAFKKYQIDIDVLCFEPSFYDNFGFYWFTIHTFTKYENWWFGDICITDFTPYLQSMYKHQGNGIQADMPAIAMVKTYKWVETSTPGVFDWNLLKEFNNEAYYGEGQAMNVWWVDEDFTTDRYRFDLYVWLPIDNSFNFDYVLIDDQFFYTDGVAEGVYVDPVSLVIDYVLGDCVNATNKYPPWTIPIP